MTDATRGAFRHGLAVCLTALVVGSLHVPQPFLAILAAQLIAGIPCPTAAVFFSRLGSAVAGSICGVTILTLAPNEQWVSLPLFFVLAGWGTSFVAKHRDPASAILFCMGIASMVAEGFVFPARDLPFGLAHTASLITASVCSAVAGRIFPFPHIEKTSPKHEPALVISFAAVASLIVACAVLPTQPTVMVVAALTTALSLGGGLGVVGQKFLGGLLGAGAALVFVILISSAGNDVSFYLLGLAAAMAGFEWMAVRFPKSAPTLRQAGAIFAVIATILPAPQQFLWGSMERMCAVLAGLLIGCGVAWGQNLASFFDPPDPRDANPETKSDKPRWIKSIHNP
jgi:hypothetical protein